MGSSLSAQEELFVSQKWAELLEVAMSADVADQTEEASRSNADSTVRRRGDARRQGFRMSFNEWQAFLGILETGAREPGTNEPREQLSAADLKRAGGAPSAICSQLSASQLHCPLVSLAVHAFALWSGAIDAATFRGRLEKLEELVAMEEGGGDGDEGETMERMETSSETASRTATNDGDNGHGERPGVMRRAAAGAASEVEDEGEGHLADPPLPQEPPLELPEEKPKSRRRRLFEALKGRVTMKKGGGAGLARGGGGRTMERKERPPTPLLDEYMQLEHLFHNLANELISVAAQPDVGSSRTAAVAAAPFDAAESASIRGIFRDLKTADTTDHPVARVALCVALALYSALAPTPLYAVDGAEQLRQLDQAMRGGASGREDRPDHLDGGKGALAATAREPVTLQWPWVASLEALLVHKQHALDVQQCLSEEGKQLAADLQVLRRRRRVAEAEQSSGVAMQLFARMAPAERWAYCESQYIGQRHIWGPLVSHFLSADIFEADKPTVLVFFGPSGYGKSELGKQVASAVHGCPVKELEASGKMVYIHMPSFSTKESIYSLVDPPAAHVGDGILLSALHQHPDAVVVLDEFEKSTAEAVQNIWLSAFQKNGVLRSLKRADRSISTVKVTFILTCNIAADTIAHEANAYLTTSASQQAEMRQRYERVCQEACRASLGDPFVNRVDSFYAFTPYTRRERQDFVQLTLERLLAAQQRKGRQVRVTPRCIAALVARLTTFHASTVEEVLRPRLVDMSRHQWPAAVLTVEARVVAREGGGSAHYVMLPCRETGDGSHREEGDVWEKLPGGPACLAMWQEMEAQCVPQARKEVAEEGPHRSAERASPLPPSRTALEETKATGSQGGGSRASAAVGEVERHLDVEHVTTQETEMQTERELALLTELRLSRELIARKDKEIATLKERLLILEKLLAVMMCVVLCCGMALYLLIGWKLTFLMAACVLGVVTVVLKVPLRVLLDALGAFFRFLGPVKSALVALLMSAWVYRASKSLRCG